MQAITTALVGAVLGAWLAAPGPTPDPEAEIQACQSKCSASDDETDRATCRLNCRAAVEEKDHAHIIRWTEERSVYPDAGRLRAHRWTPHAGRTRRGGSAGRATVWGDGLSAVRGERRHRYL